MVSGAGAMIYSYFDGIGVADVKEILMSTVTPMESLKDVTVSGGRLNVGMKHFPMILAVYQEGDFRTVERDRRTERLHIWRCRPRTGMVECI